MKFLKEHIIKEIKRCAKQNAGRPMGKRRFERETGIKEFDWLGKYWARWSDALVEAGFKPNVLQGPRGTVDLLKSLVLLTRELGHFPVDNEIRLKARETKGFPWHNTFKKLGNKRERIAKLIEFCNKQGELDIIDILKAELAALPKPGISKSEEKASGIESDLGYVYMLKMGCYYKIGRTNSVPRRGYELAIQLPEKAEMIHHIKTDDPTGIEAYWHKRFEKRRKNGEWFQLTKDDVNAFRRRKFM